MEIWACDVYMIRIRQVTAAYKKAREKYTQQNIVRFFNTKTDAIKWKRQQLAMDVEKNRKNLQLSEARLKSFDKKFNK